jgi:SEA domain
MKFINFLTNLFLVVLSCESAVFLSKESTEFLETYPVELSNLETLTEPTGAVQQSDDSSSYTHQPAFPEKVLESSRNFFQLKMTVLDHQWNDDYKNPESRPFKSLAEQLGSELIDFVDNSKEAIEPNVTNFSLVKVSRSPDASDKIFVTFVVSSKVEINGEELKELLLNQINLYGSFYEKAVSNEGFVFDSITEEEADSFTQKDFFGDFPSK